MPTTLIADEVRQHASTDPLPGLLDRRGLDARAAVEPARSDRHGAVLAVVVLDVDHVEVLDGTAGHEAGDEALRLIGEELRACARGHDVVARRGGEEFLLLLPGTSLAQAGAVVERIRGRVARSTAERGAAVTLSAGVAVRSPGQDLSVARPTSSTTGTPPCSARCAAPMAPPWSSSRVPTTVCSGTHPRTAARDRSRARR